MDQRAQAGMGAWRPRRGGGRDRRGGFHAGETTQQRPEQQRGESENSAADLTLACTPPARTVTPAAGPGGVGGRFGRGRHWFADPASFSEARGSKACGGAGLRSRGDRKSVV